MLHENPQRFSTAVIGGPTRALTAVLILVGSCRYYRRPVRPAGGPRRPSIGS